MIHTQKYFLVSWGIILNATHIFVATVTAQDMYRKVTSSNTSRLEANAGFFRLLMKGIFDPYVKNFEKKLIS